MRVEEKKLKSFILDAGILTEEQLRKVMKQAENESKGLKQKLIESGVMSEIELKKLEAYILGFPFVDLEKEKISQKVLSIIPEQVARTNRIVAFACDDNTLKVGMVDPDNLQAIDFIKKKSHMEIAPCLTTEKGIEHALGQYEKSLQAEFQNMIRKGKNVANEGDLQKMAEDLPVVKVLDSILNHAIMEGASDIHIEPENESVIIRYRVDGILHDAMTLPKQALLGLIARIKVLAQLKLDEHRLPQDGRFKIDLESLKVALRVSILPVFGGEKAVLRLLNESSKGLTFEGLGIDGETLEIVHRNIKNAAGMILSTGPTGSGKTTTLYTILDILNAIEVNIATIEDPIEYKMPRINQTQVNAKIGFTFANGLRSLLRQDPDIIMVGEIRDNETAEIAVHSAMTGHLVFSTLHTNNAASAPLRLIDMGVEPFLIASSMSVVIGQRLVRRLCVDCRKEYKIDRATIEALESNDDLDRIEKSLRAKGILKGGKIQNATFYKSAGCDKCADGFQGRCGIFEVMEVSEAIKELIGRKASEDQLEQQAIKEGMATMLEDELAKAIKGITTIEEILRVTKR